MALRSLLTPLLFALRFDPRASNSLQGKRTSASFTWRAVQRS